MKDKIKHAFLKHKLGASYRGIGFEFTFKQWCQWWEKQLGPNWFRLKNQGFGYVMARYYDDGPYAPHNVKCMTGR